ncbi:MAG TPA: hypothetical protein VF395_01055, partial [Polyangiaceae bacterium]
VGGVVTVAAVAHLGSLPKMAPGIAVGIDATWRYLRAGVGGTFLPSQTENATGGGGSEIRLVFATAEACVQEPQGSVRPLACAGLDIGDMTGTGVGIAVSRSGSALWLAPRLEGGVSLALSQDLALAVRLGAALPLRRPEFAFSGAENVFRPASFTGHGALGVEFRW